MADEVRLPRFDDWKRSLDGSVGLWDYASQEGGLTLAFAFASLLWPRLIEVEGCILLEQRFDETTFRQWRGQFGDDREAIERTMNHVHLWDLFDPSGEGISEDAVELLATTYAKAWGAAYRNQFPDLVGRAVVTHDYGPTVTLFTAGS
jgi:hypothetical protein